MHYKGYHTKPGFFKLISALRRSDSLSVSGPESAAFSSGVRSNSAFRRSTRESSNPTSASPIWSHFEPSAAGFEVRSLAPGVISDMESTMRPAMRESTELIIIIDDSSGEGGRENLFLRSITGTRMERIRINPSVNGGYSPVSGALYFIISLTAETSRPNSWPDSLKRINWKSGFEYFDRTFFIAARQVL